MTETNEFDGLHAATGNWNQEKFTDTSCSSQGGVDSISIRSRTNGEDANSRGDDDSHTSPDAVSDNVTEAFRTHDDFVRNESLAVKCSKIVVVLAILVAAVACSLTVFGLVSLAEEQDFESEVRF